jgi:hypothetical protein
MNRRGFENTGAQARMPVPPASAPLKGLPPEMATRAFLPMRLLVAQAFLPVLISVIATGCTSHQPPNAPTTRPSLATTQPSYWLQLPATSTVQSADFDKLWESCQATAHHFGFMPDRLDKRGGVIATNPLTSKQFFEVWRNDVVTGDDLADSSVATYRRTLRFDITKIDPSEGGGFRATPSVLIERQAITEKPIPAWIYLRQAFKNDRTYHPVGSAESDRGIYLPRQYWYPTGRDTALEKQVADDLTKRLAKN